MPILTEELKKKMIDFLKVTLNLPTDGVWAHYCEEGWDDDDWYEDFRYDCDADWVDHGASKIVLYYETFSKWVFKIPFRGEYNEEEDNYKNFIGANKHFPIELANDYCAGEAYITREAKRANLDSLFASTYFLCDICGTPIYVSEKVPHSRWTSPRWKDINSSLSIAKDISNFYRDTIYETSLDEEVIALFIDAYGEEKTYELIDFLYCYQIKDLHNGNVGFSRDYKIKILDYSGFDS